MKRIFVIFSSIIVLTLSAACTSAPDGEYFAAPDLDIRGMLYVSEINWGGSVDNTGLTNDADDDFIELRSWYKGDLDIGGWTVIVKGTSYTVFQISEGTVLHTREFYTIGNNTNGAFVSFDQVDSRLKLPAGDFSIAVYDGSGRMEADSVSFAGGTTVDAGYGLPLLRKSAVRQTDYFGPLSTLESWVTYNAPEPNGDVRPGYTNAVFASPGTDLGSSGESANEE